MTEFVTRCVGNPPVSECTKKPHKVDSILDSMSSVMRRLQLKFAQQLKNEPALLPDDDVKKWKKQLRDCHHHVMTEGARESDLLKDTFPLPCKCVPGTMLFEHDDFPAGVMREEGRKTDLLSVCKQLFRFERCGDNSKVIATFNGVCHSGEAKFLTHRSMMLDKTCGMVFVQFFQRKSLKTNPSGFVPDWEHPEMFFF
jgi:hypothetical protein